MLHARLTTSPLNPERRFLLFLAGWLVGGSLVIGLVVSYLLTRYLYAETAQATYDGVSAMFATELPPDMFAQPLAPSGYHGVDTVVRTQLAALNIVQARFYRPDGVITYGFFPAQIGTQQRLDDSHSDLQAAFRGETSLDVRSLAASDNTTGVDRPHVLETYVPVRRQGQIVGVAEIYRNLDDVYAALQRMRLLVLGTVTAVSVALFFGLNGVYRYSTRTIQRQSRRLVEALRQMEQSYRGTLQAFTAALDMRDHETEWHSQRVVAYAALIGRELGLDAETMERLKQGALLHDIGKIGIPDRILHKEGSLTSDEWLTMRRHAEIGKRMLAGIPSLQPAVPIVHHHHERWDGAGYPDGLRGEAIPLEARVFALADTFDAMTSDRPYRRARDIGAARDEIVRCSGSQFDPAAVAAFVRLDEAALASVRAVAPAGDDRLPAPGTASPVLFAQHS